MCSQSHPGPCATRAVAVPLILLRGSHRLCTRQDDSEEEVDYYDESEEENEKDDEEEDGDSEPYPPREQRRPV